MKTAKARHASKKQAKKHIDLTVTQPADDIFLLKEDVVQQLPIEFRSMILAECEFASTQELERVLISNSKKLFGEETFLIRNPEKAEGGQSIPAYFLLDMQEENPQVYLLQISIESVDFYKALFPSITKFFSYFEEEANMQHLLSCIEDNAEIQGLLASRDGSEETKAYLERLFWGKPDILLISSSAIAELTDVQATYAETWKRVKLVLLKKYACNGHTICSIEPSFEAIQNPIRQRIKKDIVKPAVSEELHLAKVAPEIRDVYLALKEEACKANASVKINVQRYYIAFKKEKNVLIFQFSRSHITLVVVHPLEKVGKLVKKLEVRELKESVQKFWGGNAFGVIIRSADNLKEVASLIKKLVAA